MPDREKNMPDSGGYGSPATADSSALPHSRPRFRENSQRLRSLRLFTYVTSDEVEGHRLKKMGEPVVRICYYQGELENKTFHFTFWMTREGKVAYLRFNPA